MTCEFCGDTPASVFTEQHALCRPCHRELRRIEADDNAVPNRPTCGCCGAVLNRSDVCPECVVRLVTEAHREMARVS